ncbi:MAG: hypothetical protein ACRDIC_00670, partial [bacterium]
TSLPLPGRKVTYVCHNCGQTWEEHAVPNGHAATYAVVKAGVDPAPSFERAGSKVLPYLAGKYLHSKWFSREEMLGVGSALGLATGLATMSSAGPELAARQGWVASFLLGGFLCAAASYAMISAAKRNRGTDKPR